MDSFWYWLLGAAALVVLAAVLWPKLAQPVRLSRKPDVKQRPMEEMATEIFPAIQQAKAGESEFNLPRHYGTDRLVALSKDPNWLYAYWEISADQYESFVRRYGEAAWCAARPVLRVYDITGLPEDSPLTAHTAHCCREILIDPYADNWFIEIGQPNRSFYLELGRLLPDGRYIKLLTSNRVSMPGNSISSKIDEEWMWIEGIYKMMQQVPCGSGSEGLAIKPDLTSQ
ncbi:hypothetical protein JCM39194_11460 [Desulfotomaculum varum]